MSEESLVPTPEDELDTPERSIEKPAGENVAKRTETPPPLAPTSTPRGEDSENILWESAARQRKPSVYPTKGRLVVEGGSLVFIQPKRVLDIGSYTVTGLEVEDPSLLNPYIIGGALSSIAGGVLAGLMPLFEEGIASLFPGLFPVITGLLLLAGILSMLYGATSRNPRVVARTADTTYQFDLDDGDKPEELIPVLRNA